jgi:hypothetical protein
LLATAKILADLVSEYVATVEPAAGDYRLVVPGLTYSIAKEVHNYLRAKPLRSYLVIGNGRVPCSSDFSLQPVSLTTVRVGSFIAVTEPGALSNVWESIRGSGGAVRFTAYSEEWPWQATVSETFHFGKRFLPRLFDYWGLPTTERPWFKALIVDTLLDATQRRSDKASVFLEKILGTFNPDPAHASLSLRQQFLLHCGIPNSAVGDDPTRTAKRVTSLLTAIQRAVRTEGDLRNRLHSNVPASHPRKAVLDNAIDAFLDGIGRGVGSNTNILSAERCWGDGPDREKYWENLDQTELSSLFEIPTENTELQASFVNAPQVLLSDDRKTAAGMYTDSFQIQSTVNIPAAVLTGGACQLAVFERTKKLSEIPLTQPTGSHVLTICPASLGLKHGRGISLRVVIVWRGEEIATDRLKLHCAGPQRKGILVVLPAVTAITLGPDNEDNEPVRNRVSGDVGIAVFVDSPLSPPVVVDENEHTLSLRETGPNHWQTSTALTPGDATGGRLQVTCRCDTHKAAVILEADLLERGQFTLEEELLESTSRWKKERVREVLALFTEDNRPPFLKLGGLDDRSRRRVRLSRLFEDTLGWKPLLFDFGSTLEVPTVACGDYVRTMGVAAPAQLASSTLPDNALTLVQRYVDCRNALRHAHMALLNPANESLEHPFYATHPLYVTESHPSHSVLTERIRTYLDAYCSIQEYLCSPSEPVKWEHIFVLASLDCAVHWGAAHHNNAVMLVGPWHPLVIAKRHLTQQLLVARARDRLAVKSPLFCNLTQLLRGVSGFCWISAVGNNGTSCESLYSVPTSDPGWHIAFKEAAVITADGRPAGALLWTILEGLAANLGISANVYVPPSAGMVEQVLGGFARTYPAKRHLGVYFPPGFGGEAEIAASDRYLHTETGPAAGGDLLPGGIDLAFGKEPTLPENVAWSHPPLAIYTYTDQAQCIAKRHPDLYFCAANDTLGFVPGKAHSLKRGTRVNSVLSQGTLLVTASVDGIPKTTLHECECDYPTASDIGGAFARAASLAGKPAERAVGMLFKTALPNQLRTTWTIIPGAVIDPALFVQYVMDGLDHAMEHRSLWDYRISITDSNASYFVLSTIPASFRAGVNGLFGDSVDRSAEFLNELGRIGVSIGGEAMKSGRHALGAVGVVGAARMLGSDGHLEWSETHVSFLLPVDSFRDLLEEAPAGGADVDAKPRRADLLAVLLTLPHANDNRLRIRGVAVESKFVSGIYAEQDATTALGQANLTAQRFQRLCNAAVKDENAPEKLALLQLLKFGLRLAAVAATRLGQQCYIQEQVIYSCVLSGRIDYDATGSAALLVSTEMGFHGDAEATRRADGLWIRLNRENWPGIRNTDSLHAAHDAVAALSHYPSTAAERSGSTANNELVDPVIPLDLEVGTTSASTNDPIAPNDAGQLLSPDESAPVADEATSITRILVGYNHGRQPVYFDPHSSVDRLENANVMVTGSSGKGKTQFLKHLIAELRAQSANVLVFDFKNDFAADDHFVRHTRLSHVSINFDGLPFNPLIPYPVTDRRDGRGYLQCAQHISGVCSVLRRTLLGGPQQEAAVRQAIQQAFGEAGLDPMGSVPQGAHATFPDFNRVRDIVEQSNAEAYNRLSELFSLNVFRREFVGTSLAEMLATPTILDFSQIASDGIKNTLAELVVLSAHAYLNSLPHSGRLRTCIVVDEAHRILQADYVEKLALECRAYGVSLVLASQYPSHFPASVADCLATKIIHGNDRDRNRVKSIAGMLGLDGRDAEIADLGMFDAIFSNRHFRNVSIRTLSYPIRLVLEQLQQSGTLNRDQIAAIEGVDTDKLPVGNIIRHMQTLGVCEVVGDCIRYLGRPY